MKHNYSYKGKIIDEALKEKVIELNHNLTMISQAEWESKNPSPGAKLIKQNCQDLQRQIESKLAKCPESFAYPYDLHNLTSSQILKKVQFERLKAKK
jgi:hypothetical protein